ncbi:MAG TPA: Gfo/Idh/MocA family oxidoreductase [Terriglobales bacterium]|nr:Gfo/Idh/MocA family oxidoreductase [Terriglobales bacterium]
MVRFGIIGFGLHAVKRLMPGFARTSNCKVTALSRRDRQRADECSKQFQIPHAFTSVEELCASPEVDAVLVTSPNACHLSEVLTAAKHGKHILCEKPMGMNAAECREMVEAANKAGVLLGIAHVFRFTETVPYFRQLLATGQIGRPTFAHSDFSFFAPSDHPRKWLHDRSIAGGGPIADIGVHCVDTLRYILNDEVTEVTAVGTTDEYSRDVESAAVMTLRFSKGTLATSSVSFRAEYHSPLSIHGETGVISANDGLAVDFPVTVNLEQNRKIVSQQTFSNELAYAKQADEFANAVQGKATYRCLGEEGWQNQRILDAAFRSMQSGHPERVN